MSKKLYKCPECKAVDTGDNWDNATKNFCEDDEIFLIDESASDGEFGVFHICPNCENQIDNEKIERIDESEEKCNYCEVENKFSGYGLSLISKPYISIGIAKEGIGNGYFLITNEYEELSNIHGLYSNSPIRSDKIKINYCPMCGRKL